MKATPLEQLAQAVFEITVWDGHHGNMLELHKKYQAAEKIAKKACPELHKAEKSKFKAWLKEAF